MYTVNWKLKALNMCQKHLVHFWKFLMGFCAFLEVPHWMFYIFGSSSLDFVHFWKFFMGFLEVPHGILCICWKFLIRFCIFLEVPHWILCIFGSSSWDLWKFLIGFLEVPHGILCIFWKFLMRFCTFFGSSSLDFVHFWKFFIGFVEASHGSLGSFSWDFVHIWEFLMGLCTFWNFLVGFCASLEDLRGILCIFSHGILCIFGSSSWDFVYFWKFLMGFCVFLEVPHGMLCIFGSSSWTSVHMSISLFHFFSTKYVFLQQAYWLVAAFVGCKTSSCNHEKCRMPSRTLFLYFNLCLSEKVDNIPCSFTSAFFLTRHILQKCFEYNIVNKRVSVLVFNVIFLFTYWFYLPVLSLKTSVLSLKTSSWSKYFGVDWLCP